MAGYWRILSIVIGTIFVTPLHAQPSTIDQTCFPASEFAAKSTASKMNPGEKAAATPVLEAPTCAGADRITRIEMALCLALLGCMILTRSQASRRKAIKVVAS